MKKSLVKYIEDDVNSIELKTKKQKSFWKEQVTLALENDIRILTEKIEQEVT